MGNVHRVASLLQPSLTHSHADTERYSLFGSNDTLDTLIDPVLPRSKECFGIVVMPLKRSRQARLGFLKPVLIRRQAGKWRRRPTVAYFYT
jgi:hypothetical protein